MNVWLIKDGEVLPIDKDNPRLTRMGLLAEQFVSKGYNVTWWTSSYEHFKKKFRDFVENSNHKEKVRENYNLFILKAFGYKKNLSLKRLWHHIIIAKEFFKFSEREAKPDVIIVALPTISFVCKAVKYGIKHNVPVIVDVRDLNPDVFPDAFSGILKKLVQIAIIPLKIKLSTAMKNATAIIGTTQPYLDFGLKYANRSQGENDRVFYVSYPDNKCNENVLNNKLWKGYNLEGKNIICFFGQFASMVDIDTVINAAKICEHESPNVVFMLCGSGEKIEEYKKKVEGLNNIIFPGWVGSDDIKALGIIATAGLMAYKQSKNYELQMPNKFSEYLALGLAVLVQPNGLMKEMVEKNHCGFSYNTSEDLAEIIRQIVTNKEDTNLMKLNARKLYEKNFDASSVYSEYVNHIIKIAERRK